MSNGVKILGHSVHPILIVFPLGLLATGTVFDALFLFTGSASLANAAYWMILAGVLGGVVAATFGWLDWFAIPGGTRAKRIGLMHGGVNAVVLVVFAIDWLLRKNTPENPALIASVLSFAGAGLSLVGGWLGGELVERLGVGVHPGANVNAPSSLSTDAAHLKDSKT